MVARAPKRIRGDKEAGARVTVAFSFVDDEES